jgi:GH24 family phage-related lysozyme (muramidase)
MEEQIRKIVEEFVEELVALLKANLPEEQEELQERNDKELLTTRAMIELAYHEAIVREAYRDSKGIWTWGIGVTDASGHKVARYKDNPASIARVIEIFKWLVEKKYLPDVLEAFGETVLTEEQLAAAVSFHYNTGGIKQASWVRSYKAGKISKARREFMNWRRPKEIIPRREAERDLFFDGKWSNDGRVTVYEVNKPSYTPKWSSAKRIDITKELEK